MGLTSTAMGDLAGISGDESFCTHPLHCRSSHVATGVPSLHCHPLFVYVCIHACMLAYIQAGVISIHHPSPFKHTQKHIYTHISPPPPHTHTYVCEIQPSRWIELIQGRRFQGMYVCLQVPYNLQVSLALIIDQF